MDVREYLKYVKGGLPTRAIKLALFLLLILLIRAGINSSVSYWLLAVLPITWAACPPRVYRIPRDTSRLLRLTASLSFIYLLAVLVLWAIYEWDTNIWEPRWWGVLLIAALIASSRFKRWADLPPKQVGSLEEVVEREAEWIERRRAAVGLPSATRPSADSGDGVEICGLALSGGGIRSATVCLGFVTELMRLGLFRRFDYLSTVSGGGWLGCAVTAMLSDARASDDSPPSDEERARRLMDIFRRGRVYIGAAKFVRALAVMLFGAGLTMITVGLLSCVLVIFMFLADTYYMLPAVRDWSLWVTSHVGPGWLYETARTEEGLSQFRPYEPLPALLVAEAAFLLLTLILKLLGRWLGGEGFRRLSVVLSSIAIRLFLVSALVVCALQGREILTAVLCAVPAYILLNLIGRPRRRPTLLIVVLLCAATPWLADAVFGWNVVDKVTNIWYYLFLYGMFLPVNLLITGTANSPMLVTYDGLTPPRIEVLDLSSVGSDTDNLFWIFQAGFVVALVFIAVGVLFQRNRTGLYSFWRSQIAGAFISPAGAGVSRRPIATLRPTQKTSGGSESTAPSADGGAPLHIINCAVNLPGSADGVVRSRAAARFEMSPYFVGGPVTGWADSRRYHKLISLAAAAAISAAAINPQSGKKIPGWANWILLLANFRLGVWLPNPRFANDVGRFGGVLSFAPLDMLKELMGTNSEEDATVFVSDGGHEDNLGVTALVERGCRLIVAVDAAADPGWNFEDLNYALSLLGDRGWRVTKFDIEGLSPQLPLGATANRLSAHAVGEIELLSGAGVRTRLLLLKACLTKDSLELLGGQARRYVERHKNFPQESTADQWYSEAQFEAYVGVGKGLAESFRRAVISNT